ncbi:MAG: response regulator [Nanoarchaeota archaeon]
MSHGHKKLNRHLKMETKKRILHIDDDSYTLKIVKDILKSYALDGAQSGKEGLAKLQKNKYDLILLDIIVSDMSGWDIYRQIRANGIKTKVAFLSIIECSTERMKMLKREGLSDYILKPIKPADLKRRVADILKQKP